MHLKLCFFFCTQLVVSINSQTVEDHNEYDRKIRIAESLYEAKNYKGSATNYSMAFKCLGWKGTANDRYNAACSWALASVPDSAFFQLMRLTTVLNYTDIFHIANDPDLYMLHEDARWQTIVDQTIKNKELADAKLNRPLTAYLDSIFYVDQHGRLQTELVKKQFGWDSKELKQLWKEISYNDSLNLIAITNFLNRYGWLGADEVGNQGNDALFLVIQHSNQTTQEKYLPMMREAVKNGKARASSLALLEDRVALGQGKRQIYGSQIGTDNITRTYYLLPLEDALNVDRRRAEVGLGPIAEYVKHWNIVWDAKLYKNELPKLEKKLGIPTNQIK